MSDLSPEARALIDAARAAEKPVPSDKARVAAALASRLAIPLPIDPTGGAAATAATGSTAAAGTTAAAAGTTAAAGATAAAVATKVGVVTAVKVKLALVVAAASAGGVVTWNAVQSDVDQAPPAAVVRQQPPQASTPQKAQRVKVSSTTPAASAKEEAAAAPAPVVPAPAVPAPVVAVPVAPPSRAPVTRPAAPPAAIHDDADEPGLAIAATPATPAAAPTTTTPSTPAATIPATSATPDRPALAPEPAAPTPPPPPPRASAPRPAQPTCNTGKELALLRNVQAALRDKKGRRALTLLKQHARDCSSGTFAEEARAARTLAYCLTGQRSRALDEATTLVRESPRSPQIARLRSSCAASALPSKKK